MKNSLVITVLLAMLVYGCGSGRMLNTSQPGERTVFQTSSDKEPDWVKKNETLWYDPNRKQYNIVGMADDQQDMLLGSAMAQADAVRNLAQRIRTIVNTRFAAILTEGSSNFRNLSDLLVSMITHDVQLSIAMTQRYWIQWQINDGTQIVYRFQIYTLNTIDQDALSRALALAVENSKRKTEDPELRSRLDEFEKEMIQDLNKQQ